MYILLFWDNNISVTPPPQQPTITKLGLLCYSGGGDKQNYYRPLPATSGDFVNTIWRKRQQEIHCFYYKLATPTSICTSSCRSLFIKSCRIVIRLDNFYIVNRVLTIGDVIGCGYIDSNRMLKIPFLNHEKRFLLFTSGCPLPGTR